MSRPAWINVGHGESLGAASVTAATDRINLTGHGLSDGDLVMVDNLTGGADGVLVEGAVYFVRNADSDSFQLSGTRGSQVKEFDADGGVDVYAATPSYNAQELRRLLGGLLQRGDAAGGFAARSGLFPNAGEDTHVTLSGTTWTVNNLTGVINTGLTSLTGPYLVAHQQESGSVAAADGSLPRIDALDLQVQDHDEDASGFRRARVVYATGTPASTPAAPSVTPNALRLATILVPAGGSPGPTLTNVARFTVAKGGVIPVRTPAEWPGLGGRYRGMPLWDISLEMLLVNENAGSNYIPAAGRVRLDHQALSGTVDTGTDLVVPEPLRGLFRSYVLEVNAGVSGFTNRPLVVRINGDDGTNYRAQAEARAPGASSAAVDYDQNNVNFPRTGYVGGFTPSLMEIAFRPGSLGSTGAVVWKGEGWANNGSTGSTLVHSGGRWSGSSGPLQFFRVRTSAASDTWVSGSEATLWGIR